MKKFSRSFVEYVCVSSANLTNLKYKNSKNLKKNKLFTIVVTGQLAMGNRLNYVNTFCKSTKTIEYYDSRQTDYVSNHDSISRHIIQYL